MSFRIEFEQEVDGRWTAEIPSLPGVMVYRSSREEARWNVEALALRVLAGQVEHGQTPMHRVEFAAA